ncbi:hypothetical protein K3725_04370 [Leisingera sp. S132]|uniref:hypothetical protein n=1 Tax=Leisingera sp. S132 TaxID=2867016 RepID=UPI0021A91BBC|nr:hypothetical protein [Leisingera sp. S132]UWQ80254.1 hypothetical protein K3725_04370 [Leisingera sp. S132]
MTECDPVKGSPVQRTGVPHAHRKNLPLPGWIRGEHLSGNMQPQQTPKQWDVSVQPDGHSGLDCKAGQFVWLKIGHSSFSMKENSLSICSAPGFGPEVSSMIKELGGFTQTIGQIKTGTAAYLDGSYGNLCVDGRTEPGGALIAGGVGLVPLLGIVREMRLTGDPRKVKLMYGNRVVDQIAFRDELGEQDVLYVL